MENLRKALQAYLTAETNRDVQVALDSMTAAIKSDITTAIADEIKLALETAADGGEIKPQLEGIVAPVANFLAQNKAKFLYY